MYAVTKLSFNIKQLPYSAPFLEMEFKYKKYRGKKERKIAAKKKCSN